MRVLCQHVHQCLECRPRTKVSKQPVVEVVEDVAQRRSDVFKVKGALGGNSRDAFEKERKRRVEKHNSHAEEKELHFLEIVAPLPATEEWQQPRPPRGFVADVAVSPSLLGC